MDNVQNTIKSPLQVAGSNGEKQLDRTYWRQALATLPFSTMLGVSNAFSGLLGYAPEQNQTDLGREQERLRRREKELDKQRLSP
jgi:hypothetical protein